MEIFANTQLHKNERKREGGKVEGRRRRRGRREEGRKVLRKIVLRDYRDFLEYSREFIGCLF